MGDLYRAIKASEGAPEPPKPADTTAFVIHLYSDKGHHLATEVVHGRHLINEGIRKAATRAGVRHTGMQSVKSCLSYQGGRSWNRNSVRFIKSDDTLTEIYDVLYGQDSAMLDEYPKRLHRA